MAINPLLQAFLSADGAHEKVSTAVTDTVTKEQLELLSKLVETLKVTAACTENDDLTYDQLSAIVKILSQLGQDFSSLAKAVNRRTGHRVWSIPRKYLAKKPYTEEDPIDKEFPLDVSPEVVKSRMPKGSDPLTYRRTVTRPIVNS